MIARDHAPLAPELPGAVGCHHDRRDDRWLPGPGSAVHDREPGSRLRGGRADLEKLCREPPLPRIGRLQRGQPALYAEARSVDRLLESRPHEREALRGLAAGPGARNASELGLRDPKQHRQHGRWDDRTGGRVAVPQHSGDARRPGGKGHARAHLGRGRRQQRQSDPDGVRGDTPQARLCVGAEDQPLHRGSRHLRGPRDHPVRGGSQSAVDQRTSGP